MIVPEGAMRHETSSSSESRKPTPAEAMLAPRHGEVVFRELRRDEIEEIISRNKVGRIAFAFHDRVDIHGSFWRIHPLGSPHAEEVWAKAAELVGRLVPGALTEQDPVGFRQIL